MSFTIQAGKPRLKGNFEEFADNVGHAIENIYELDTEYMIIIWNYILILLSYKYDLSEIIEDVLKMLTKIRLNERGSMNIVWPSNTFSSTWKMNWDSKNIELDSEWTSVIGETESLLNRANKLLIDKEQFCSEWKMVLENLIQDLNSCGYKEDLQGMVELLFEYDRIQKYGNFYCKRGK